MDGLQYFSKYQNLHMDRANQSSMTTVNVSINTDWGYSSTPRLLYRYDHGYDYIPQFWGLWDIQYSADLSDFGSVRRGYGYVAQNPGGYLAADFFYEIDDKEVRLYLYYDSDFGITPRPKVNGTKLTFTGYVFANDRKDQLYK